MVLGSLDTDSQKVYCQVMENQMNIVALGNLRGDLAERAGALAEILGITIFEARNRVRPPAPRVAATFADKDQAHSLAKKLANARFDPFVLGINELRQEERSVEIRSFELRPSGLLALARDRTSYNVRSDQIQLLIRGSAKISETQTDTSTERHLSVGKALATGGLSMTTKKTIETSSTTERKEGFVQLYTSGHPILVFKETVLQYQGLGKSMQLANTANFAQLIKEIKERAGAAPFDDRLVNAGGQAQALGGILPPERYLNVALAMLSTWYLKSV
jgi:hypothetical protein